MLIAQELSRLALLMLGHVFGVCGVLLLYVGWQSGPDLLQAAIYLGMAAVISWITDRGKKKSVTHR